jgi:hypothetical protein
MILQLLVTAVSCSARLYARLRGRRLPRLSALHSSLIPGSHAKSEEFEGNKPKNQHCEDHRIILKQNAHFSLTFTESELTDFTGFAIRCPLPKWSVRITALLRCLQALSYRGWPKLARNAPDWPCASKWSSQPNASETSRTCSVNKLQVVAGLISTDPIGSRVFHVFDHCLLGGVLAAGRLSRSCTCHASH